MIKVYKDPDARVIIFDDGLSGTRPIGTLHCIGNGNGTVDIVNKFKYAQDGSDLKEYASIPFGEFVDENNTQYGTVEATVVNLLNAVLTSSGGGGTNLPEITSSFSINSVEGVVINYEMVANFGVGYEWENLPSGLVVVEGNIRKILGVLTAGVYTPTMRAVNYNGVTSQTLTITVADPPFSDTKSVVFNNSDYATATSATTNPLYRAANGSGSADAWSISTWFKPGTNNTSEQTILMFGGSVQSNEGRVHLFYNGGNSKKRIQLLYGSDNNKLFFITPDFSVTESTWHHIFVTYDGGTTGSGSGSVNDYYSRFKIYIDGVLVTLVTSNSNYGWSSEIVNDFFMLGRNGVNGNYMRTCNLDEVALWSSDQSGGIANIYNAGAPQDLTSIAGGVPSPDNWWRMGDGDTFPTLTDNIGSVDFTMVNMTASEIVNDVP